MHSKTLTEKRNTHIRFHLWYISKLIALQPLHIVVMILTRTLHWSKTPSIHWTVPPTDRHVYVNCNSAMPIQNQIVFQNSFERLPPNFNSLNWFLGSHWNNTPKGQILFLWMHLTKLGYILTRMINVWHVSSDWLAVAQPTDPLTQFQNGESMPFQTTVEFDLYDRWKTYDLRLTTWQQHYKTPGDRASTNCQQSNSDFRELCWIQTSGHFPGNLF